MVELPADAEWWEAIKRYKEALRQYDEFPDAYNEMGYAYRKLGKYDRALEAYDRALDLEPTHARAIEYRAEAYLQLGRLNDAQNAYMELFRIDQPLASQLMERMQRWVKDAASGAGEGVSPDALESFRSWMQERAALADQLGETVSDARSW